MKIGLDYQRIWANYSGGTTTFAMGLLEGFAQCGGEHSFIIFAEDHNRHLFEKYADYNNFELIVIPPPARPLKKIVQKIEPLCFKFQLIGMFKIITNILNWRATKIKDGVDLLYVPTDLSSYNQKIPTFCSLHDIQQVHFPEFFNPLDLSKRFVTFNACAQSLSILQASSNFIKYDFLKYFSYLDEKKVVVIPEGVNIGEFKAPSSSLDVIEHYALPKLFLYYPGQLWPHKNHLTVLKALLELRDCFKLDIPLVLTGQKYSASDEIFDFAKKNSIKLIYLGVIPYDHVKLLYRAARFTITAVFYESSSIPMRESAAAGTPVVASNTPPNIELAGVLELNLFNPNSSSELANLLNSIWSNEVLIERQASKNSLAVEEFSWNNVATKYLKSFNELLGN